MAITLIDPNTPTASVDYESEYSKELSLKTLGPWHYLNHPKVEIHTVSIVTEDGEWVGRPWEFDWDQIAHMRWVSHNAAFDRMAFDAANRKYNIRAKRPTEWQCTANLVAFLGSPRALDGAVKHLFDVSISKDTRKQMMGRSYTQMVADGFAEQMEAYALDDSRWCRRIFVEYQQHWPELEQRASLLTMVQTERGLPVNPERLELGIKLLQRKAWEAANHLPWRNNGSETAVLSPIQLAKACRDIGVTPPKSLAEDNPACTAWCLEHPEITWVKDMRDYRKSNLLLTKLQTMLARIRDDGRLAYGVKYFGGHTGRWSGDQGLNVHGFGKDPMVIEDCEGEDGILGALKRREVDMAEAADQGFVVDMRACVEVLDDSLRLFINDLSQIEPRFIHLLAGDHEFLDGVREGMSPYEVHARQVMGWIGGVLKDEDPKLYNKAKPEVLGLGYGMGADKYRAYALGYGVTLSAMEAKKVVNMFRKKKPLLVAFWDDLHEMLMASMGDDLTIELPSGRNMVYRDVHKRIITNKTTGRKREQVCATIGGGRLAALWGSLLAENVVQGGSRDVFLEAMLRVEDAGLPTILSVHDEMVGECDKNTDKREIQELIAIPPDWAIDLPVASDGHLSRFYKK